MSLLDGAHVVALDVETTGMSPEWGHAVVEVGAVTLAGDLIEDAWATFVDPGRSIPADAWAVHGISDAMVAGAPHPAAVGRELRRRCGDALIAFHNHGFDLPFVVALLRLAGERPLGNPVVDTLGLARGLPDVGGHGLQALAARFGLPPEPPHRALGDALTTARLLVPLAERWARDRGVRTLAELAAISQDALRAGSRREPEAPPA